MPCTRTVLARAACGCRVAVAPDAPAWLTRLIPHDVRGWSDEELLALSVGIAEASVRAGGGPFGAVIVDDERHLVAAGWNQVVATHDSTAHAEIVAIRRLQARLATHDLFAAPGAPFTLYTSCAPCIQCFGALYWSGIAHVVAGGRKELAEAVGFQEGPVSDDLWATAKAEKGLVYALDPLPDEVARCPFDEYRAAGGPLY